MIYDPTQQRLRLRVAHEFKLFPYYSEHCLKISWYIKRSNWQPGVWAHILNPLS